MKLGKEEIQKIILSAILLLGLLYCYFNLLLGPLEKQQTDAEKTIGQLTPQIADAKGVIKDAATREKNAAAVSEILDQIKASIPDGAPIAWFPPAILGFFKRQGIDKCTVHVISESGDKDLPGFKKMSWDLTIPRVEVVPLAIAIAALENEQPLWEVTEVHIDSSKENVQYQAAKLTLSTIVKQ